VQFPPGNHLRSDEAERRESWAIDNIPPPHFRARDAPFPPLPIVEKTRFMLASPVVVLAGLRGFIGSEGLVQRT